MGASFSDSARRRLAHARAEAPRRGNGEFRRQTAGARGVEQKTYRASSRRDEMGQAKVVRRQGRNAFPNRRRGINGLGDGDFAGEKGRVDVIGEETIKDLVASQALVEQSLIGRDAASRGDLGRGAERAWRAAIKREKRDLGSEGRGALRR